MGGWSLTVALCSTLLQARNITSRGHRRDDREKKIRAPGPDRDADCGVKRDREGAERRMGGPELGSENITGVRRRMELQKKIELRPHHVPDGGDSRDDVLVNVRADLFVNARSWERVRAALGVSGPLKLHCRFLRVEELHGHSIASLLHLLPRDELLGLDVRYSSLGVSGLALLLPQLALFPRLNSLRLHYCNLFVQRTRPGQEEALQEVSQGLGELKRLRRLSLTALRLPGHLRLLLRYFCCA